MRDPIFSTGVTVLVLGVEKKSQLAVRSSFTCCYIQNNVNNVTVNNEKGEKEDSLCAGTVLCTIHIYAI